MLNVLKKGGLSRLFFYANKIVKFFKLTSKKIFPLF